MSEEEFLSTKEYKRFQEFCEACRQYKYIGLCYGPPGVGKTLSAKNYSNWDLIEKIARTNFISKKQLDIPHDICNTDTMFYTAEVVTSPSQILNAINNNTLMMVDVRSQAKNYHSKQQKNSNSESDFDNYTHPSLVIIDESDRLKLNALEQIRDYYDKHHCGLILIGMPGMEKKLSRYPQLYSRVGFVHEFKSLSQEEMIFIMKNNISEFFAALDPKDFTDHEVIAAIVQVTRGNFRLLNRLLKQVERIMKINMLKTLTKEVILSARECLVIGV